MTLLEEIKAHNNSGEIVLPTTTIHDDLSFDRDFDYAKAVSGFTSKPNEPNSKVPSTVTTKTMPVARKPSNELPPDDETPT